MVDRSLCRECTRILKENHGEDYFEHREGHYVGGGVTHVEECSRWGEIIESENLTVPDESD